MTYSKPPGRCASEMGSFTVNYTLNTGWTHPAVQYIVRHVSGTCVCCDCPKYTCAALAYVLGPNGRSSPNSSLAPLQYWEAAEGLAIRLSSGRREDARRC